MLQNTFMGLSKQEPWHLAGSQECFCGAATDHRPAKGRSLQAAKGDHVNFRGYDTLRNQPCWRPFGQVQTRFEAGCRQKGAGFIHLCLYGVCRRSGMDKLAWQRWKPQGAGGDPLDSSPQSGIGVEGK